jgi:hypothetical protein
VSTLAIDVALLLPVAFRDAAIALNRALRTELPPPIALDRSHCVPHVSLAMGCVAEDEIPALAARLETLAAAHAPVELVPTGFHARHSQTGYVVASLELERTAALQALHAAAMRAIAPYAGGNAAPDMFLDPAAIPPSTLRWVTDYATAASFERFWPHVTLGMGALPEAAALPAPALASRLALCRLGPHCTCRRVLFAASLGTG